MNRFIGRSGSTKTRSSVLRRLVGILTKEQTMKTSELTGPALDWAVAKCLWLLGPDGRLTDEYCDSLRHDQDGGFSTDWSQGGPIIEREKITIWPDEASVEWLAEKAFTLQRDDEYWGGTTPLIAAMRCYVASKLGDEVEVPDELL